jgi:uncharacterized protein (TIGR02598 family)
MRKEFIGIHKPLETRRIRKAFSLVEIIIALGIVAFAILSMVALLPIALRTFLDSKKAVVHSNILQEITADATLTNYTNADSLVGLRYYDDEGTEMTNGNNNWVYKVNITLSDQGGNWSSASASPLPGVAFQSQNMRKLRVELTDVNAPKNPTIYNVVLFNDGLPAQETQ